MSIRKVLRGKELTRKSWGTEPSYERCVLMLVGGVLSQCFNQKYTFMSINKAYFCTSCGCIQKNIVILFCKMVQEEFSSQNHTQLIR